MTKQQLLAYKQSNRLINETSPYLLQHAHNPVDWYPWGPEALQQARDHDKPILLSIGYAACHWCHVMAHESFEDPATAQLMNDNFINIKVDREERPDLDEIYMRAVQAMTGHGGWPMTMFLTPQLKPFFGGTYFPPDAHYNMPSFKTVLNSVAKAWSQQRRQIEESAVQLTGYLSVIDLSAKPDGTNLSHTQITNAAEQILNAFDRQYGGLGSAPKFPHAYTTDLIMRTYTNDSRQLALQGGTSRQDTTEGLHDKSLHHDKNLHDDSSHGQDLLSDSLQTTCREFIETTLNCMAHGGIHDQLGGGFARYSVDRQWLIPHFEKMLYDNAALAENYLCGYQLFKNEYWKNVAIDCLDFVTHELKAPEGAFYSSLDADSEGSEGKFYVWTPAQITEVLGNNDGDWFNTVYDITSEGNFEHGTSVLNLSKLPETPARGFDLSPAEFWAKLRPLKQKLLESRSKRIRPGRDEKVLTGWNALMISAYVKGFQVAGNNEYLQTAVSAMQFILANMYRDGRLLRTWAHGQAHLNAYLEDYAFIVQALLDLASIDPSSTWLAAARELNDFTLSHFFDKASNNFFYTSDDHEELILRTQNNLDGPLPSSTSVAVMNLLRLARIFADTEFETIAENVLRQYAPQFERAGDQYSNMLCALDLYLADKLELVIVANPSNSQENKDMLAAANRAYLPNLITVVTDGTPENTAKNASISLLADRVLKHDRTTAYLCHNSTCREPVTNPSKLEIQLQNIVLSR